MKIAGFAINADAAKVDGSPDTLREELDYYARLGFPYVEIAPHGAGVMFNGRLNKERMKGLLALLAGYPFRYVVHGPNPMNLMNMEAGDVERRMFISTIEFTAALGAGVMVYHAGRFLPEEKFLLPGAVMPSLKVQKAMLDMERSLLGEMGDLAARYGVTIAVENARPFLDASPYCYGEFLDQLGAVIREINHPRVGVTLDLGHAYLAACHYHFDLLDEVEAVAPYVRHIHLHDNFGKICASYEKKQAEMAATGRGDMHLPVGWGEIPAGDALARLNNFNGVITLEMRPRYSAFYGEALANARALVYGGDRERKGELNE
ncbi:sugar phosphate isomerase/epimerase family protein [Desulfoscipio sp. XC116]|uniref:sugar phosphate isomerase/epimerase family protein n=1 Tax=Desulfoscipio sp. XC116 TaxID=3144975 RepID=UPI00325A719E